MKKARDDYSQQTDDELDRQPLLYLLTYLRSLTVLKDVVGFNFYAESFINMRRHVKLRNRDEVAQQNALARQFIGMLSALSKHERDQYHK